MGFNARDSADDWPGLADSCSRCAVNGNAAMATTLAENVAEENVLLAAARPFKSSATARRVLGGVVGDATTTIVAAKGVPSGVGVFCTVTCSSEPAWHIDLRKYPRNRRVERVAVSAVRRWLLPRERISDELRKTSMLDVLTALVELHSEEEVATSPMDGGHECHCSRSGTDAVLRQVLGDVDWTSMCLRGLRLAVEEAIEKAMRPASAILPLKMASPGTTIIDCLDCHDPKGRTHFHFSSIGFDPASFAARV